MKRHGGKGIGQGSNGDAPAAASEDLRSSSDASSSSHFSAPRHGTRGNGGSSDGNGGSSGGSRGLTPDRSDSEEPYMSSGNNAPYDAQDEALVRWRKAAAVAAGPGGARECFTAPEPLANGWLDEAIAVSSMLFFFGWVLTSPALAVWLLYRAVSRGSREAAVALALWFGSALLPGGRRWQPMADWHVWATWRRYFRLRWVTPARPFLEADKRYLFLHFPHAVFPMGSWLSMGLTGNEGPAAGSASRGRAHRVMSGTELTGIPQWVPGAIASVLLQAPLVRHLFWTMGCFPADRERITAALGVGSLGFLPEGIAGIFNGATRQRERIFFNSRKGIVAIAIRSGADIVPTYFLGQSQMFDFHGFGRLSRRLRVSLGVFWGRWGLPLPRKTEIVGLVGAPIPVTQKDNPTHADVDELHARITEAVRQLYERHRELLPADFADRHLEIL